MSVLSGAVETAPVSSLHSIGSANPDDFPVPTGREEEWRFTPLNRLRKLHADAPLGSSGVTVAVEAAPELGVKKEDLTERKRPAASGTFLPADRVSARAFAAAGKAMVVTVPKEAVASRATIVHVVGTGTDAAAGHLVIDVQPFGRAVVVIDQQGSATYADNIEVNVADGGDLTLVWVAEWDDDTVQVSHHQATLGRDAHLKHIAVTVGGAVVRLSPTIRYAGPGGDAELYGITFADAGQHLEHRLFVDHDTPNCRSRVTYKSALAGDDAHTVWIGDVLIRPEATGTDTYEYNRNLVLTDGARADSVPNLEILTG
jgi:Fe-S cluster assembly protein SufD